MARNHQIRAVGYGLLSRYRGELMGIAMLWVMLFHAYGLSTSILPLRVLRATGFAGVDIFLLLSGMGICCSLARRERNPMDGIWAGVCAVCCPPSGWWWACTAWFWPRRGGSPPT